MAYTMGSKGADNSTTRRSTYAKKQTELSAKDKKNAAMQTRANKAKSSASGTKTVVSNQKTPTKKSDAQKKADKKKSYATAKAVGRRSEQAWREENGPQDHGYNYDAEQAKHDAALKAKTSSKRR